MMGRTFGPACRDDDGLLPDACGCRSVVCADTSRRPFRRLIASQPLCQDNADTASHGKKPAMNTIRITIMNADGMVLDSVRLSTADETTAIAYRVIKGEVEARPEESVLMVGPCQRKFEEHVPAALTSAR